MIILTIVNVYIGQSGSGKTTEVLRTINLYKDYSSLRHYKDAEYNIPYTLINSMGDVIIAIGHYYNTNSNHYKRCMGTDEVSYTGLNDIIEFMKKHNENSDIYIVEGERITYDKFFDFLKEYFYDTTINVVNINYHVCSIDESQKRVPTQSRKYISATQTKSYNVYRKYKDNSVFSWKIHGELHECEAYVNDKTRGQRKLL